MGWALPLPLASARVAALAMSGAPLFGQAFPSLRAGACVCDPGDNEAMWEVTVERTSADEEVQRVRQWRRAQFMRLGFGLREAQRLANDAVDLNAMRLLVSAGCPPETAERILL
jgi:hypothetical protein